MDEQADVKMVWHYTDATGLLGILSSGELWATQMSMLNDSSEMTYGCSRAAEVLESAIEVVAEEERSAHLEALLRSLDSDRIRGKLYVLAASRDDDSLNQWMHYGNRGFAVGLNRSVKLGIVGEDAKPAKIEPTEMLAFTWSDVSYGDSNRLQELLDAFRVSQPPSSQIWSDPVMLKVFYTLAALIKHPAFSVEQETRYLVPAQHGGPFVHHRVAAGRVVPYVKLGALTCGEPGVSNKLPIVEVRVGPPVERASEMKALESALASSGYSNVRVSQSTVPYRAVR